MTGLNSKTIGSLRNNFKGPVIQLALSFNSTMGKAQHRYCRNSPSMFSVSQNAAELATVIETKISFDHSIIRKEKVHP